jgi:hypothetical protein
MIMIPVMILQIFLFPLVATMMMDNWAESQRTLELQETAGLLGSTIQQMSYAINRASVSSGSASMKVNLDIPKTIENHAYMVTLHKISDVETSYSVMNITLHFISVDGYSSTVVTLGSNANWEDNLSFNSNSQGLSLVATKTEDAITLTLEDT